MQHERLARPAIVFLIALSTCAGSPGPKNAQLEPAAEFSAPANMSKDHSLAAVRAAAGDIRRAWLVQPDTSRRIELNDEAVRSIEQSVSTCEPSSGLKACPPPWPGTVVEFEGTDGKRYVFELVTAVIRVDSKNPHAPSLAGVTDPDVEVSAADCSLDWELSEKLWEIHERHLGPSQQKQYLDVGGLMAPPEK